MTLVVVESPTKAKTIGGYLGKGYTVLASVGHVRDLPKSNKDAVDIDAGFVPKYVVSPEKREVIAKIKEAAEKADEVLLATDPDREGEAIAWHVAEVAKLKKPKRVVFHEITERAIKEAIAHPRAIDTKLRHAQEARRVLDRLVGYDLSGMIWKKVRYGLSAGRVQSPALRILMEREREIRAFVAERYFVIAATARAAGGSFPVTLRGEVTDPEEAARIVREADLAAWTIGTIIESEENRQPRAPFTTSTLQQAASTRLGFSPSRTMRAAQKLYEAGHITYMRTDSTNLAPEALASIQAAVASEYGKEHAEPKAYKTKSKNAQEAHEAVRPTDPAKKAAGATEEEQKLYALIRARALSSQMKPARLLKTSVRLVADRPLPEFGANGSRTVYPGWLLADPRARGEDVELPKLSQGEAIDLTDVLSEEKFTEPPKRYTDAGLIKELEKRGIGRPSTYASIIRTLLLRGYVERAGRSLQPTATGDIVSSFLEKHFPEYVSDTFTAEMEDELDDIARGEREYEKTLREFYTPFLAALKSKEDLPKATDLGDGPKEFPCPKCGSAMGYKLGRGGVFLSCKRFPECDGARTESGGILEPEAPIGVHPETGEDIFVLDGKFGPYVQLGKAEKAAKGKKAVKPRRASIPPSIKPDEVTVEIAVRLLSLPKELGVHPVSGKVVSVGIGRFGPYVVHDGEFRSIKEDDPYTIELPRALALLAEPKKPRKGVEVAKELGAHPKTGKQVSVYKSKAGLFLAKGLRRIYLADSTKLDAFTVEDAVALLSGKA